MVRQFVQLSLGAALLLGLTTTSVAAADLTLTVTEGDSVGSLLSHNAARVRDAVSDRGPWQHLSPEQLVRALLRHNMQSLPHGINVGNRVEVSADGTVRVTAGSGKPPTAFASVAQMRNLVAVIPDAVHDHVESLAGEGAIPLRPFAVADDGSAVTVSGETFTAGDGIRFSARTGHFHVISPPPMAFNTSVWPFDGVPFEFPPNPFYRVGPDRRVVLKSAGDGTLARLLTDGEIHAHDDHFHITRSYGFEPWQKLVALAAAEDTAPIDKQLAASVQVAFLREHLYISSTDSARDLAALNTRLERAWAAVAAHYDGPQLSFVVQHNAALEQGGKIVRLGDQMLSAGDGLHFGFCKNHVHVVGDDDSGLNMAITPAANGPLRVPPNVFVQQRGDQIVLRRMGSALVQALATHALESRDGAYHPGSGLRPEALRAIAEVVGNRKISPEVRGEIRAELDAIRNEAIPVESEPAILRALERLGKRMDELQKGLPSVEPPPAEDPGPGG
jgi:hypothetical protein